MEPRPLNTKLFMFMFLLTTCQNSVLEWRQKRVSPPVKCAPSTSCVPPVMTAVTVRLMDRALKPEMTPLYQFHAQKAPLGAFRNKNVTFGKKKSGFQGQKQWPPKFQIKFRTMRPPSPTPLI